MTNESEALKQAEAQQRMGASFLSAVIRVLSVATFHQLENAAINVGIDGLLAAADPVREEHGRAELQAFPQSGCVMSLRVEVPGLPVNFYAD